MELRHLRYFQAVAEALNFSRAAEKLRVAQPALSRQIQGLEHELGVRLFDRNRVRVQLTDAGRTFYTHVCKVLAQVDIAVASVRDTTRGVGGRLIISNDWRLAIHLILETIAEFRQIYPGVDVELVDLPITQQLAAVRAGRVHLCFQPREVVPARGDLAALPILHTTFVLVVSRSHRLARRRSIGLAELRDETFIGITVSHSKAKSHNTYIVKMCRTAGFAPIFGPQKASSLESLLAAISAGFGITLLPDFICPPAHPLLSFVPTDCPETELCAVWMRSEESLLLRQYLDILRKRPPSR
ncbi:MAG: LysR substrate-binding domain-containing protein [Opitutaceae bacterium]|nr:LysR substrate-binding domain-containing protein [Opitutaceae bacterium]